VLGRRSDRNGQGYTEPLSVDARTRPSRFSSRRARPSVSARVIAFGVVPLVVLVLVVGLLFRGSSHRVAAGVRVAGVNVGGLTAKEAQGLLERRANALLRVPVTFVAGDRTFRVTPDSLGVRVDWAAAVAAARRQGEGFGPFRGFKRIDVRVFGADITPTARVYTGALGLELTRLARAINRPHREPAVRLRGLEPVLVAGRNGRTLNRKLAAVVMVRALASLERGAAVRLPVRSDPPRIATVALAPATAQVRRALAAPVVLTVGPTRFRIPRWRLAQLLELPADGRRTVRVGGPAATEWLATLGRRVQKPAQDAEFAVDGSSVRVLASKPGVALDGATTARRLLRASLRPTRRIAPIAVVPSVPDRTTDDAKAMRITGLVSSYTTTYGGIANRIHNVQLVAHLVDDKLIAPGATFSFNGTTGERTAAKGFLEAPVIINGELQTGLGGGVCQVSTTVFNAAYEAGLRITQRTNHALYISHYPQGRDATVDYPNVDLQFVNDTDHWLLLRTFVGSSQLTVNLYGTPQHRKIVSTTAPLVQTSAAPLKKVVDPSLDPGEKAVEDFGSPGLATSVHRRVYDRAGKLLHDDTWYSSYRAEPKIVHIGPKKKKKQTKPGETSTSTTSTTATRTTTAPAQTTQQSSTRP
jgi:vancomycin resistance protein YoaR